jgi:hypothetical protein
MPSLAYLYLSFTRGGAARPAVSRRRSESYKETQPLRTFLTPLRVKLLGNGARLTTCCDDFVVYLYLSLNVWSLLVMKEKTTPFAEPPNFMPGPRFRLGSTIGTFHAFFASVTGRTKNQGIPSCNFLIRQDKREPISYSCRRRRRPRVML